MIKEILIFMLCLQFSIAVKRTCKDNTTEFIAHKTTWMGSYEYIVERICILSNYKQEEIREPPAKYTEPPSQTNINIEMSKFQIIRINEDSVAMSLYFKVEWIDQRLQLLNFFGDPEWVLNQWAFKLKKAEQNLIWIPQLAIRTEMISEDQKVDYVSARIHDGNSTSGARVSKSIYVTTEVTCDLDFKRFPFDRHVCSFEIEDQMNETIIERIKLKSSKMSKKKNVYIINAIEEFSVENPARFGIKISFKREDKETHGILINYNLMCAIIVLVSSVNFLIDPTDSNRAAILIALILILATVFQAAQAEMKGFNTLTQYIFICMIFMAMAMLYYGLIIFKLRRFNKIEHENMKSKMSTTIIKLDRLMLAIYCIVFGVYNACYFIVNFLL